MAFLKSTASGSFTASTTFNTEDVAAAQTTLGITSTAALTYTYTPTWTETNSSVVNGIVIYVNSTTSVGTFTIGIFTSAGTTPLTSVTVNTSDLLVGYNALKFTGTTTLTNATAYRVGYLVSSSSSVVLYGTTAPNIYKRVMTTATAAPTSADTLFIMQDILNTTTKTTYTVTMDNTSTATTYNAISIYSGGTLSYGVSSNTNYYLKLGANLGVSGGTFTMGTLASPIPSTSTAKLEFVCASANQYGITVASGSTVTTYGATKLGAVKLGQNVASGTTSATTDVTSSWLNNDIIVMPPTNRTAGQFDTLTLSGNASGTTLNFTTSLTFPHETYPSTPTYSDIINLTRNVQIFGQGTSFTGSNVTYIVINGGTVSFNYTSIYYIGSSTSALSSIGLASNLTAANSSVVINNCAIYGTVAFNNYVLYHSTTQTTSTFSMTNTVIYGGASNINSTAQVSISNTTIDSCVFFRCSFNTSREYIVITNCIAAGSPTVGFGITDVGVTLANGCILGTINNLTAYSCGSNGIQIGNAGQTSSGTITNINCWRNLTYGLSIVGGTIQPLLVSGGTFTANQSGNVFVSAGGQIYMDTITTNSHATYTTPLAFGISAADKLYITNSSLGVTTAETNAINPVIASNNFLSNAMFYNTTFGGYGSIVSATAGSQIMPSRANTYGVSSMNHNGVANSTFNWQTFGTITTDSTIYYSSTYSMRMTPASASWKMTAYPIKIAIKQNDTVKILVNVRKSSVSDGTAYNGNQPRLMLLSTPLLGFTGNTVYATASAATGSWETLTATFTPTVSGVYEFYVDCDGTTGWINVDDWSTNYVKDTTKMDYWFMGLPEVNITGIPKERSTVFIT